MKRLVSLDVLRGLTVAFMIIVNNAGGKLSYAQLRHSQWHGLTMCDLVLPFFLFIVGISTYISLRKFNFTASRPTIIKILRRSVLIFVIGLAICWFDHICEGDFFPIDTLRIPGVLQRIAICYLAVSLIAVTVRHSLLLWVIIGLLVVYSVILWLGNGFDCNSDNILAVVDRNLVGEAHLYHKSPVDPEGFLSSISAIAHTLIGFYVGSIFIGSTPLPRKIKLLASLSVLLAVAGLLMSLSMPFNKRIWSPSYTVMTCAIATAVLAVLMFLIDYKGYRRATPFFLVFGVNPLFLYVVSEVLAIVIGALKVKPHIYGAILTVVPDPYVASAIYSLAFMLLLFAIGYPLYRRRIYIKI